MKAGVVALLFLLISSFPIVPAVAQYDDDIVVAQEWEGIYELLLRFEFQVHFSNLRFHLEHL